MINFFIKLVVNVVALFAVLHIVAGISVDSWQTAVMAAVVIGFLNAFLRPFFIMLTLPLNIMSFGFLTLIINGFMFYLAGQFVRGFYVADFWSAFWAALLFSLISFVLNLFLLVKTHFKFYNHSGKGQDRPKYKDVIDVEGKPE